MKRLKVPTINVLDVLDITSIGSLLEEKAQREYISHANWREYPYKPITVFDIVRSNGAGEGRRLPPPAHQRDAAINK